MLKLSPIIKSIKRSSIQVSKVLKYNSLFPLKKTINITKNVSGDFVKPMDIVANNIFIDNLSMVESVYELFSEEEAFGLALHNTGEYSIAIDPLDGSDNIDTNEPIGSLFCIFKKERLSAKNIRAAGYIYYGVATQMVIAIDKQIKLYQYSADLDDFIEIGNNFKMPLVGKVYSNNDGNNHLVSNEKIKKFLEILSTTKSLRYTGCLVADLHRLLFKGGCFCYPGNDINPNGKIRLLYEAYAAAYIIEIAGGYSRYNDTDQSLLDITSFDNDIHKKTPIFLMGEDEKDIYDKLT